MGILMSCSKKNAIENLKENLKQKMRIIKDMKIVAKKLEFQSSITASEKEKLLNDATEVLNFISYYYHVSVGVCIFTNIIKQTNEEFIFFPNNFLLNSL